MEGVSAGKRLRVYEFVVDFFFSFIRLPLKINDFFVCGEKREAKERKKIEGKLFIQFCDWMTLLRSKHSTNEL